MAAENRANFEKCDFLQLFGAKNVIFYCFFHSKNVIQHNGITWKTSR